VSVELVKARQSTKRVEIVIENRNLHGIFLWKNEAQSSVERASLFEVVTTEAVSPEGSSERTRPLLQPERLHRRV
jgi:hypothetical protein